MSEDIYYHRYSLESQTYLNSVSNNHEHEGLLVKCVNSEGVGYANIHPWEELGDASVELQLEHLKAGESTRLIHHARECVVIDREARIQGVSLFGGLDVPRSYATVVGGIDRVEDAVSRGFDTIKMKGGEDWVKDLTFIHDVHDAFPELRYRVDFNNRCAGEDVGRFAESLSYSVRKKIDYLEDPCRYDDSCWIGMRDLYGMSLAMDLGVEDIDAIYAYSVTKPVKNDVDNVIQDALAHGRKVVVTSYMDHPLGQAYAAYCAGKAHSRHLGLIDQCGLMTQHCFKPNAFSEVLGEISPDWTYSSGTGLGFDELLCEIDWKPI